MQKAIKRYFPVFVLPTLIAFTIGFLAPFVLGVYLSFCKFTTMQQMPDLLDLATMQRYWEMGISFTLSGLLHYLRS